MRSAFRKVSGVLIASFLLAIGWPSVQIVSAAPKTVESHTAIKNGRAPIRFNLIGAEWNDRKVSGGQVRTSLDGTTWSEWYSLDADASPDASTGEGRKSARVTNPIFIGDARFIETRGLPAGTLHFLNVNGDADDPNPAVKAARAAGRWMSGSTVASAAGSGPVGVFTRAQWGADERLRTEPPDYAAQNKMVIIHHTDGSNNYSASQSAGIIRGIYYYHVKVRDFRDIAYNFLVDKYGQLFEGRWGGMDKTVIGAHSGGFNTGSVGIAALGMYDSVAGTKTMLDAVVRLLNWKMSVHAIMPRATTLMTAKAGDGAKWAPGTIVRLHTISGHRDVDSTACPGAKLYSQIQYLRDHVRVRLMPPGTFLAAGWNTYRVSGALALAPVPGVVRPTWSTSEAIVRIDPALLNAYKVGPLLPFRTGTLVQGDTDQTLYIANGNQLRPFSNAHQLVEMGFNEARVVHTTTAILSNYAVGPEVDKTAYPNGSVLRSKLGGGHYMVLNGVKRSIPGAVLPTYMITNDDVVLVDQSVLDALPAGPMLPFMDGTLVMADGYSTIWIITQGGQRRPFESMWMFNYYGYSTHNIRKVSAELVRAHPLGGTITGH